MHSVIESVAPYISHYGYWAIFLGVLLENSGFPLPGETIIVVGGLFAAKGTLELPVIILLGILAAFIGTSISYFVGYFGGSRLILKYGKFIFINEQRLCFLQELINRHGNKIIILARFIIGLRQFCGYMIGISRMPYPRFLLFNFIGAALWVGWWAASAYYLGKKLNSIFIGFRSFEHWCFFGLILFLLLFIVYRIVQKRTDQ